MSITETFRGHGKIDVTGGKGFGGGAGGRIAIHALSTGYHGQLLALGGIGSNDIGGTGTVYIESIRNPSYVNGTSDYVYTTLILDNQVK